MFPAETFADALRRTARTAPPLMVPRELATPGRLEVDATWGTVQPLQLAPDLETVGELEVVEHIRRGLPLVDTRLPHFYAEGSLPGARNIPYDQIIERIGELDRIAPTVLFCNGPQCLATPRAVEALLAVGYPPRALRYYRGGVHDWVTLGYRLTAPDLRT